MRCLGLNVHKDFAELAEALPGGAMRQLGRIRTMARDLQGSREQVARDIARLLAGCGLATSSLAAAAQWPPQTIVVHQNALDFGRRSSSGVLK
jgi:hypothetical protein